LAAFDINSDIIPLLRVSEQVSGSRRRDGEEKEGKEEKEEEEEEEEEEQEEEGTYYVAESCD
jgi:hypothetical protein